jgi:hypothetical protein
MAFQQKRLRKVTGFIALEGAGEERGILCSKKPEVAGSTLCNKTADGETTTAESSQTEG